MLKINIGKLIKLDYRSNEAFKRLRTNIQFCGNDVKVITITSCIPNDGKSSVSLNLAVSLSQLGKKVLFIDCDLRKSVIVGKYKIGKATNGMTHYLTGMKTLEEVVYSTNIENLYMALSGPVPPNPAELLANKKFDAMLETTREIYDYIIIDTPPLGSVVDASIVAGKSDGVALVVAANAVSHKYVSGIIEQIRSTDTRFLGIILNKVDFKDSSYYGKYYGKYGYGDYGKYGYGAYGAYSKPKSE